MKKKNANGAARQTTPRSSATLIDTEWFKSQLAAKGYSLRSFADELGVSHSSVQRLVEGRRELRIKEVKDWAEGLGVSEALVLAKSGLVSLNKDGATDLTAIYGRGVLPEYSSHGKADVPVQGWVDGNLLIHRDKIGFVADGHVTWPNKGEKCAIRFQGMAGGVGGGYWPLDGAIAFYEASRGVSGEAMGRLCVVRTAEGLEAIRMPTRGYSAGKINLLDMAGNLREQNVDLTDASPVLAILFPSW